MARKVFISVLGTGLYNKCKYIREKDNFSSSETPFIQTASLEYLNAKSWCKDDVGIFLLTDCAKSSNWNKDITHRHDNRSNQDICYKGLEKDIEDLNLPISIVPLDIFDGNNESDIWNNFARIYEKLKDDDELYFDVTHAFRFLPMLILVLCNYAKFLKNVTVKSITYGNYEARNTNVTPNEAPIIDLLPLSQLQDWTYAAGQYFDSGNVNKIVELSRTQLKPILANSTDEDARTLNLFVKQLCTVIEERTTCRGKDIISSTNFKKLKSVSEKLNSIVIKPLSPIVDKIKSSFNDFDENENVSNGFSAAKWCLQNGLYQQAITITLESLITYVCLKASLNWQEEEDREVVNKAFKIKEKNLDEAEWMFNSTYSTEKIEKQRKHIRMILEIPVIDELLGTFLVCTNVRNDFNHAGMKANSQPSNKLKSKIEERILKLENLFSQC